MGTEAPDARLGLYPEWFGSREVLLHGRNPYAQEATDKIQIELYGHIDHSGKVNQQRFAYPAYFALLFAPIALLPFPFAKALAALGCCVLMVVGVSAWSRCFGLDRPARWLVLLVTLSTYPAALAMQLCQPTVLISCCLALAVYAARSGYLRLAGFLAAVGTAKPHIAVGVLLPLTLWAFFDLAKRRRFLLWFAGLTFALVAASELMVPGWISDWLATTRAYAHYAGASPILADVLHGHAILPVFFAVLSIVVLVSYRFGNADPLFAIAFSVAAFQLVLPFLIYNEIVLLPAALWLMKNVSARTTTNQLATLLTGCSWVVLASGMVSTVALSIRAILSPASALPLWQFPLISAWCYPLVVSGALLAATFRRTT